MGPFGYGNLGDAAIVEAALQSLRRRYPDSTIVGFTLDPEDTERRHGITSFPLSRTTPRDVWADHLGPYARAMRRLRTSRSGLVRRVERVASRVPAELGMLVRSYRALDGVDVLIACGSGQIQDYWGGGGPFSYPYTMLRWALLARLRRAKFMIVSIGAGPISARLSRRFFRWALSLASYRSFRDEQSRALVADVTGLARNDPVYPDLAFSLAVPGETSPTTRGHVDASPSVVGVGPIGYYREGNWPEADDARYARYLSTIVAFVNTLLAEGHSVVFLKGEARYDQAVIDDITARLNIPDPGSSGQILDAPMDGVDGIIGALARCDVVVASRFHNVLLSYLLGRPVLALSYQSKIDSLMEEFDQAQFCLPISDASPQVMLAKLIELQAQPDFPAHASAVSQRKRMELEEQYDHIFAHL
jgi:polysaccharide pyruvyl transferase WcaK-like protein